MIKSFWAKLLLFICACLFILFILGPTYLRFLGKSLVEESPEPPPVSLIIVLSGGQGHRVEKAVELYKKGLAKTLLMTGGPIFHTSHAQMMKEFAQTMGVPSRDILVEPLSKSTYENATFTLKMIEHLGVTSAIVVTSKFHTKRASNVFRKVFPSRLKLHSVGSNDGIDYEAWWKDYENREAVLIELAKRVFYFIVGRKT